MGSLANALVRAVGALLAVIVILSVFGAVTAIAVGIVTTIVTLLAIAFVFGLLVLAGIGLSQVLRNSRRLSTDPDRFRATGRDGSSTTKTTHSGHGRLFATGFGVGSVSESESESESGFATVTDRNRSITNARERGTSDSSAGTGADPATRLRERYVAGDIDEDEFERQIERLFETSDIEARLTDVDASDRTGHSRSTRERTQKRTRTGTQSRDHLWDR